MRTIFFLALLFSLALFSASESFKAFVNTNKISEGDSFTLTLEFDGRPSGSPELDELEKDFNVISRANTSSSSFINGVSQEKTKLILTLSPKKNDKNLLVPAIKWGSYQSQPIAITQSEESPASAIERGLSLVAHLSRDKVYVNAELILNIELKTSRPLRSGNLAKPEIDNGIIESLSENDDEVLEGGINYQVFRRSYAIFPSKPGTLTIPSIRFDGLIADESARGWFSSGQRKSARTKELKVSVLPVPESFPKDKPFLALKNLVLVESFDEADPKFEVNKATTRRFELKALGALSSSLPIIEPPSIAGLKVYSEPGLNANKNTEDGMEASIKFSHVYMPMSPGKFHLPEQKIYWWDTEEDKLKTTIMRPFDFEVSGEAIAEAPLPTNGEDLAPVSTPQKTIAVPAQSEINWWIFVAAALGFLWCLTMALWFWQMRHARGERKKVATNTSIEQSLKELVAVAKSGDSSLLYQKLNAFKTRTSSPRLQEIIKTLQASLEEALYDPSKRGMLQDRMNEIAEALASLKVDALDEGSLTKLYPF